LNIPETGDMQLLNAKVVIQPWAGSGTWDWGGIVELVANYKATSGTVYPIKIDYLHLIAPGHNPRNVTTNQWIDNNGKPIAENAYKGCSGFGPDMKAGATLSAEELAKHPLIGYLGATETPHTHIQATYSGHNFDPAPLLASN
jgi:hypothetical protein